MLKQVPANHSTEFFFYRKSVARSKDLKLVCSPLLRSEGTTRDTVLLNKVLTMFVKMLACSVVQRLDISLKVF